MEMKKKSKKKDRTKKKEHAIEVVFLFKYFPMSWTKAVFQ